MTPYNLSIFVCSALLLAACSKDSEEPVTPPVPDDSDRIEININPSVDESRATDTAFESGDCVGLYVVNYSAGQAGNLINSGNHVDNMRFRYSSGAWVPDTPIYWLDKETHADFYLYYPYTTITSVTAQPFAVKANQSKEADYKASDFLVGKACDVAPTSGAIDIPANHIMSRIIIEFKPGDGFTTASLSNANVAVKVNGIKCSSTVNIATGNATATGEATSVTPLNTNGVYSAIIVPQAVAEGNLITVTVDGRDYNLVKAFTFERAQSHRFTVTLNKTSNGVNVNINPWGDDGVDNGGAAE